MTSQHAAGAASAPGARHPLDPLNADAVTMIYVRGTKRPPYFTTPREVFRLEDAAVTPTPQAHRQ